MFETVPISYGIDLDVLSKYMGLSVDVLLALNPSLLRGITPMDGSRYELRVPPDHLNEAKKALASIPQEDRIRLTIYKVRRGDTLSKIASRHRVSVAAIQSANRIRNVHRLSVGQELMIPLDPNGTYELERFRRERLPQRMLTHRVRRGDTLSSIAMTYQTSVASLTAQNPGIQPERLQVGQRIAVLQGSKSSNKATEYVVMPGDTLAGISRRFRTTVSALVRFNRLESADVISIGQRLKIPQ